jgi:hypothetical protein
MAGLVEMYQRVRDDTSMEYVLNETMPWWKCVGAGVCYLGVWFVYAKHNASRGATVPPALFKAGRGIWDYEKKEWKPHQMRRAKFR